MKWIALLTFLILNITCLTSQRSSHLEQKMLLDTLPKVTGNLSNYQPDLYKDLFINYTVSSPDFQGVRQCTAAIEADGSFKIDLENPFPYQKIRFTLGDLYQGFLIVNSNLQINIDLNEASKKKDNFDSKALTFNGDDGGLSEFYNSYYEYKADKKTDVRRRKFSSLRNRTSQGTYKVKQLSTFYEELEKIEVAFCKKNGSEYKWLLENERLTEYYGDLTSIFIGRPIPANLWQEILDHKPLLVSDMSNRFYGIIATKLWSHEEKEMRSFSKLIFKAEAEDDEEKKEIDLFMIEQDKKKAGVPYDNEVYAKGIEKYVSKYELQLADAKLDLFLKKLKELPAGKKGLVAVKGQPLSATDRIKFIEQTLSLIDIEWQADMMRDEMEEEEQRLAALSIFMSSAAIDGTDPKLGTFRKLLPSEAGLWSSSAKNVPELLRQIKGYYKENALIIYLWNTNCTNCLEELQNAGLTYDQLEDEPLDILSLALNQQSSSTVWENILLKNYVKGQHIFLDKKLTSEIIEYFQLPPVPCYLYFDGSGNFIPYKLNSISDLDIEEVLSSGG